MSVEELLFANAMSGSLTVIVVLLTVVVVPLTVKFPLTTASLVIVTVPPFDEPILTFVVEDDAPPVPKFNVLVLEAPTAPVDMLVVDEAVLSYPIVEVVAAPAKFTVVAVVLKTFWVVALPTNVPPRMVVVVPELAPIVILVQARPKFIAVVLLSNMAAVPVDVVVMLPPFTARSPVMVRESVVLL